MLEAGRMLLDICGGIFLLAAVGTAITAWTENRKKPLAPAYDPRKVYSALKEPEPYRGERLYSTAGAELIAHQGGTFCWTGFFRTPKGAHFQLDIRSEESYTITPMDQDAIRSWVRSILPPDEAIAVLETRFEEEIEVA